MGSMLSRTIVGLLSRRGEDVRSRQGRKRLCQCGLPSRPCGNTIPTSSCPRFHDSRLMRSRNSAKGMQFQPSRASSTTLNRTISPPIEVSRRLTPRHTDVRSLRFRWRQAMCAEPREQGSGDSCCVSCEETCASMAGKGCINSVGVAVARLFQKHALDATCHDLAFRRASGVVLVRPCGLARRSGWHGRSASIL